MKIDNKMDDFVFIPAVLKLKVLHKHIYLRT